jgi:glycosyltransferase involved in cell wall biosynthesis
VKPRLAVVATHPIQYVVPWYRHLERSGEYALRVFYLWNAGVTEKHDHGFGHALRWDLPLLEGYEHEFVRNLSPLPGTHRPWGLWNPSLVARVRAWRPDAVLLWGYNYLSLLGLILRWRRRDGPLLLRGDSHRLLRRGGAAEALRRGIIAGIFRRFSGFLYVGSANRDYFSYHGVGGERLFHVPHAVENDRFFAASGAASEEARRWRAELGIPVEHLVVLFAGKFERKKRPLDLLEAFRTVRLRDTSLLFVGAGELERDLREAARGVANVHFAPFQNQTGMPRVYAVADLFVLPSFGATETWGLAVNEAMCMGRAVVVSDHVGCAADLVVPRVNGLVFPAGDVKALSAALGEALADPQRLRRWGEAGRERIRAFDYERMTAGLRKALQASAP